MKLRRLVFNFSKLGSLPMRIKWWAEKHLEPRLEACPAGESDGCLVSRNHPMHDSVPYLMNRLAGETDILQEYFIPRERFVEFVDGLRRITLANRANLLNASVRVVHQEDNFLTYAPRDMFAVVLYLNQTDGSGREHPDGSADPRPDRAHAGDRRTLLPPLPASLHGRPAPASLSRRSTPSFEPSRSTTLAWS